MERGADIRGRGSFLSRRGELAVLLSLSGLALLLMLLTNSTQAAIARHVEDFVLSPFRTVDRNLRELRLVLASNRELEAELAAARLELARTEEVRLENERLRGMLGFEGREGFALIGCEVMAEGAGRLGGAIVLLNRGYNQGLREGMALIGRDGLVGKVVEVRPNNSHALLLTHPDCAVAARVERSRVAGIVEWQPGSFTSLKLRNISYLGDVQMGDRVISSGLGGVFPEGIPVGSVSGIEKDVAGLVLDITIKPSTNFRALEEIFALRSEKAGAADEGAGSSWTISQPAPSQPATKEGLQKGAVKEAPAKDALPKGVPPREAAVKPPAPIKQAPPINPATPDEHHGASPSEPQPPTPPAGDTSSMGQRSNARDTSAIWTAPDSAASDRPGTTTTP